MIRRHLQQRIEKSLFKGRVITIFGARRVGKTTLAQTILANYHHLNTRYINCDLYTSQLGLAVADAEPLKAFIGETDLVVLDEAQAIPEIGRKLKILVDTYPEMQIIATGSSSFGLRNQTGEPLTGRVFPYTLYPLSLSEIAQGGGFSVIEPKMDNLLRYGLYPGLIDLPENSAREQLDELVTNYLYRDVLLFMDVRKSSVLEDLVRLLALQVGNEVSPNELGTILGVNRRTVETYIDFLEQSFIVFKLRGFSRNLRKEVGKTQKIYFIDVGVRNAILQAFAPLNLRNDLGALWENFCIVERRKLMHYAGKSANTYFWRTYDKKEIDYIEERDGVLNGFECKWSPTAPLKIPSEFLETYPGSSVTRIDRSNYWRTIM